MVSMPLIAWKTPLWSVDVTENGQGHIDHGKDQDREPEFAAVGPAVELKEQMTPIHCLPLSCAAMDGIYPSGLAG